MEDTAAMLGGFSGGSGGSGAFDLSEVDFEYVERLGKKDARKLRGIIAALEQEGAYPDLVRECKKKLVEIDPSSAPLVSGVVSKDEQKDAVADLLSWSASAKAKDAELRSAAAAAAKASATDRRQPALPVRGHADSAFESDASTPAAAAASASSGSKSLQLGQELNASKLLPAEVAAAALAEKEKGNECFRAREFDDAVVFYTRSLHLSPRDTTTLNNRALTFLKLKQVDPALNDAQLVLQVDANNWKALWRRGQVYEEKRFLERALDDMRAAQRNWARTPEAAKTPVHPDIQKSIKKVEQQLLEQDPKHPYVAHMKTGAAPAASAAAAATTAKDESKEEKEAPRSFKRMAIAEVDEDEEEEEEEEEKAHPSVTHAPAAAPATTAAAAATASPPAGAPAMRRMPIAVVDDEEDEEDDDEEIVAPSKPAAAVTAAASSASAPAQAPQPAPARAAAAAPAPAPAAARAPAPKKPKEPTFHSKSGGMMIELVSDEEEEEEEQQRAPAVAPSKPAVAPAASAPASVPAPVPATSSGSAGARGSSSSSSSSGAGSAAACGPFVMPAVPASSVAFARDWAELRAQQRSDSDLFAYLRRIEPSQIGRVVGGGGALTTSIFSQIGSLLAGHYLGADLARAVAVLQALERTERFALNVGMMEPASKKSLRQALQAKIDEAQGADTVQGVSVATLQQVLKRYA